jgi:uncharacterized membrane protein
MPSSRFLRSLQVLALAVSCSSPVSILQAQGAKQTVPQNPIPDSDADHIKERNEWFFRGRLVPGKPSAELRHRAYQAKLQMRARHAATPRSSGPASIPAGSWTPLGPMPLASDATGNGTQDYHQVAGRATAIAVDPADPSGNTIYIGGAQSGVWKSTNAANNTAGIVVWTPVTDDTATLSIGAIAIQPGNTDPAKTVILAATGEANNSGDSYFGLGILRSADAGTTWNLISTANSNVLSFSGLGGTRMAFSTASGQMNTVVAAMATTSEGLIDGKVTVNTTRGLYTSLDAGQTWTYDALVDPGGATDATSATSVAYNASAGQFFAAVRYHGIYSSPDGINWTRLAVQPGGALLSAAACPPLSTSNSYACPIYRAEITGVPGRNEMYAWYISLDSNGSPVDGGIWQSLNAGASWTSISGTTITNCGDVAGCGVQQGAYNLELLAVPNGSIATDLYAGAINLYKCGITSQNPTCAVNPFMNLTHVYGCNPIGAPAHVHPDQHALAYAIPSSGTDSGNALLYFANDGGIYRALNGFAGLNTGSCSGTNQFDDLNQNLGSMTQFVSFSQHPTDQNTLLGGTQDNGSPATSQGTTNTNWGNVLGGDGGYNAIDAGATSNWYASNPDIPPGGLGVQVCTSGVNCNDSGFSFVVTSGTVGGDDGAFYFPYLLDPRSSTAMLVGTCRVWRGSRAGGAFTALSPNFDTLGSGTCSGSEVNQVRALATAGQTDSNGSDVIYATTSGLGPLDSPLTPAGGRVWVTTNASAGIPAFADVTDNGPQGNINPNQFPISSVATDSSDLTGGTAYVTIMGFTGGPGHVWKTASAGASWIDFTGNLPDSPVNAVVVYAELSQVYVATDVGVFASSTAAPSWTELGPIPGPTADGFLPNVAVTALGVFASGGHQLLRASTYGRGMWQFNLITTPDFQISISNSPQTVVVGQTATFNGLAAALNAYSSSVTLSCVTGVTPAPGTCSSPQSPLTPGTNTPFSVTAGGAVGDYYFNLQGVGSDTNQTTHQIPIALHISSTLPDFALSESGTFPTVNAGSTTTSGPINVTANTGFTGTIALTCSLVSGAGSCSVSPSSVTSIPTTANVTVNATTLSVGTYQMLVQGTSSTTTHRLPLPFNVGDYQLSGTSSLTVGLGGQGVANLTLTPSTYYGGKINATCDASALAGATCSLSPVNPITVSPGSPASLAATINVPSTAALGTYNININTQDSTGIPSHNFTVSLTVGQNFLITSSTASQTVTAGQTTGPYNLTIQPVGASFGGAVTMSCSGLPVGAQCPFNPPTAVTPGTAAVPVVMTISTAITTTPGTYSITVTGTSASLTQSVNVSLIVTTGVSHDFQLAVLQPFSTKADAGSSQTAKVSVTPNYGGLINTGCDASAVAGAQCTVTPANPVTISANTATTLTVTVNLPNTAAPATYQINLTVADSSGQPSHALPLPITVIADFSLNSATPAQSVNRGQTTGPYQLTIAPNPPGSSFTGAVTLSCSGLPAQAQCLFSPSTPVTPGNSTADVVMNISTTAPAASLRLSASHRRLMFYAACLLLPGIALSWVVCRRPRQRRTHLLGLVVAFLPLVLSISMLSCGGVSNGGGGGGSCSSIPSVPTGLAASSTTSTTTTLTWTASAAGSGCSVTYPVYENSTLLATPANATFNVSGLSAGTQYSFAVGASDSYGVSTPSAAISVTTLSSGTPVGTYVITVTATSGTLSHSATVTLIVD